MGTSSSQRSPATPEWERVRELYRRPEPDPAQVAGAIVQALSPATQEDMSGPGVAVCLDTLLAASGEVAGRGLGPYLADLGTGAAGPPALALAAGLRAAGQDRIIATAAASRFAEIGVDALAVTAMDAASGHEPAGLLGLSEAAVEASFGGYAAEGRLWELAQSFVGYDFDRAFRYFVARDLSDFVGTESFPHVGVAQVFLDDIGLHCRGAASRLDLAGREGFLRETLSASPEARLAPMQGFLGEALGAGLGLLGAGGGP
jgi:hypothetical protein